MNRTNLLSVIIILFSFFLSSCCNEDNVEVARHELTQYELELIPYTLGQKVVFEHSNGYEFNAYVEEIATEWQQYYDFCEWYCCGQEYFSYQTKRIFLVSSYPNLRMRFRLNESIYSDYIPMNLHFDINHRHFLSIPYDSLGNFQVSYSDAIIHDSVVLNGQIFRCVVEKNFEFSMFVDDPSINIPESILYSKEGLLQIKMSNDETFTIKK